VTAVQLAFDLSWDPAIRGILVVAVGVVVLFGSTYLLLATNVGSRLGFLIAGAGFWGWMALMGLTWWIYGIGYIGPTPTWHVTEVVNSEAPEDLSAAELEDAHDLSTWRELPPEERGDPQAAADAALTGQDSPVKSFEASTEYITVDAFETGGKDPDSLLSELPGPHPPHHAIVQVQRSKPLVALQQGQTESDCPTDALCYRFGETPPRPEVDESAPITTVIMVRDLGHRRLPPALICVTSFVMFAVFAYLLHSRDKAATFNRARATTAT
jgi:hypothetical protein